MRSIVLAVFSLCLVHCYGRVTNDGKVNERTRRTSGLGVFSTHARGKRASSKSYLLFDNRSGQSAQLVWRHTLRASKSTRLYIVLRPDSGIYVDTYRNREWFALQQGTNKRLLINNATTYQPKETTTLDNRPILVITTPGLPKTKIPEKNIETLVVADYSALVHHGSIENVTRYVMTLFKLTTQVFYHETLTRHGIHINVVLSKIVVLQKKDKVNLGYGKSSLGVACDYLEKVAKGFHTKFDHMIFLTRTPFGTGGYARPNTMCSHRPCSVIYDHGFTTTFLIAHEMAHTLGLDDKNFKERKQGYIMSGMINANFNNYEWSPYSQTYLLAHLRSYSCLDNVPKLINGHYPFLHKYPGVHYSFHDQCVNEYGQNYTVWPAYYSSTDPCEKLKCTEIGSDFYNTFHSPPLTGTKCGKDKWCIDKTCQKRNESIELPDPIHGNWGQWESWKACSVSCGDGIRTRVRQCNNPSPRYGGKYCIGTASQISPCSALKKCLNKRKTLDQICVRQGKEKMSWRRWSLYDETKVNLNCTFENDTCSWANEIGTDQQNWILNKGKTSSSGTGPLVDHTKHNSQGQYIYFESSGPTLRTHKARLSSPKLAVQHGCLTFWYSMFGARMGTLRVIKTSQGASKTIWTESGSKGNKWLLGEVETQESGVYQISFEAEKDHDSYLSDIALDDITFRPGPCDYNNPKINNDIVNQCSITCSTIDDHSMKLLLAPAIDGEHCGNKSSPHICHQGKCKSVGCDDILESGNKCSLPPHTHSDIHDAMGADFGATGPPQVGTCNGMGCDFKQNFCCWDNDTSAYNMYWTRREQYGDYYIEVRSPQNGQIKKKRMKTSIISPEVVAPTACLTFEYRMSPVTGAYVVRLKVKLLTQQKFKKPIWLNDGPNAINGFGSDLVETWKTANINITRNEPYQVVVEGILGGQYNAKIAVRNIRFYRKSCSTKG